MTTSEHRLTEKFSEYFLYDLRDAKITESTELLCGLCDLSG